MSDSLEEAITPNADAISADQKEFKRARKRLAKAYTRKAHWENRILRGRRAIEICVNKINGHLSSEEQIDYERFLPPEAQLTSPCRITGSESIKLISDLQASLDATKLRVNALLDENYTLRARLSERGRDLSNQVSRLDMIIEDLYKLKDNKEQEMSKMDEDVLHDTSAAYLDDEDDEDDEEQQTVQGGTESGDAAPDGDMEMEEADDDLQDSATANVRSPEADREHFSDEHSESTITPPPSLRLRGAAGAETMNDCSQEE